MGLDTGLLSAVVVRRGCPSNEKVFITHILRESYHGVILPVEHAC